MLSLRMTGICPHCEQEVDPLLDKETKRKTKYTLVLCPNCMKILGVLPESK